MAKKYPCRYCSFETDDPKALGGHYSMAHREEREKRAAELFKVIPPVEQQPTAGQAEGSPVEQIVNLPGAMVNPVEQTVVTTPHTGVETKTVAELEEAEKKRLEASQDRINLSPEDVGKAYSMSPQYSELNGRMVVIEQKIDGVERAILLLGDTMGKFNQALTAGQSAQQLPPAPTGSPGVGAIIPSGGQSSPGGGVVDSLVSKLMDMIFSPAQSSGESGLTTQLIQQMKLVNEMRQSGANEFIQAFKLALETLRIGTRGGPPIGPGHIEKPEEE